MTDAHSPPDLSFVIPSANENRWSDLLASLIATDFRPIARLIGETPDAVQREVVVPGLERRSDRLDLLLSSADNHLAAIEVKLLADLGPQQLKRYQAAFPDVGSYIVLHLESLPVNLRAAPHWHSLTWETVLSAHCESSHPWVANTARAWLTQLDMLVPRIDADTVWNDVPDGAADFELALRARIAWLARQMDSWCDLEHDVAPSSGGGNRSVRMWASAVADPEHLVTAEVQEGLTAYEWRVDPQRPYRSRLPGPVALVGLRQEGIATSAGFDWDLLHQMFTAQAIDENGHPRGDRAWHTTAARPTDPVDKANWQAMVQSGAPRWLGKGWGMKDAQSTQSYVFGARFALAPTSTLGEIDAEMQQLQTLIADMAPTHADRRGGPSSCSSRTPTPVAACPPLDLAELELLDEQHRPALRSPLLQLGVGLVVRVSLDDEDLGREVVTAAVIGRVFPDGRREDHEPDSRSGPRRNLISCAAATR